MPPPGAPPVEVLSADEAAALDRATIAGGVPSRALMQRAAAAAAGEITRRHGGRAAERGVAVHAGTGNNGGDAWAVAGMLARVGLRVHVAATGEPRTPEARAERDAALALVEAAPPSGAEAVVVDGVLGVGASGAPRGPAVDAIAAIAAARGNGARIVALDVPSGVDATTGETPGAAVAADLTVAFGAAKRGLLVARAHAGTIVVVDVGFVPPAGDATPRLVTAGWARAWLPAIRPDAHKGVRRHVVIVGGAPGMAGAAVLAARGAVASGAGIVKVIVAPESLAAAQALVPAAIGAVWPADAAGAATLLGDWPHAVLIGPGLGASGASRALVERVLRAWAGPVVLDADALNVFAGDLPALAALLGGRPALLTPHVAEFARLAGGTAAGALANRFDAGLTVARDAGATVLLKGVPTVVTAPDGRRRVSATGNAALAAGGSGDVLGGVAATLLAQSGDALAAGAAAAWYHGRAAERAVHGRGVRGVTLDDLLWALARGWAPRRRPARYPVVATLPGPRADAPA